MNLKALIDLTMKHLNGAEYHPASDEAPADTVTAANEVSVTFSQFRNVLDRVSLGAEVEFYSRQDRGELVTLAFVCCREDWEDAQWMAKYMATLNRANTDAMDFFAAVELQEKVLHAVI